MVHLHSDWKELLRLLIEYRVRFVLVGAHAVAAHGRPRLTGDLDVLYEPTKANAHRLRAALAAFGFPTDDLQLEELTDPDKLLVLGRVPNRVDLLTSIDGVSFRQAWKGRLEVDLGELRVAVLGLRELVANKRAAGRPKDLADLALLEETLAVAAAGSARPAHTARGRATRRACPDSRVAQAKAKTRHSTQASRRQRGPDPRATLRDFCHHLTPGEVHGNARRTLVRLLQEAWDDLGGHDQSKTWASKLGRAETLSWSPPVISFALERHGSTVLGSTRAEVHQWVVDVEAGAARAERRQRRQLQAMAPRLNVKPLAEEVAKSILSGADSPYLKWMNPQRTDVRVFIGKVIADDAFARTVSGRRRRFRAALEALLAPADWMATGLYRYGAGVTRGGQSR